MEQWKDSELIFRIVDRFILALRFEPETGKYRWWELVGGRWCSTVYWVDFGMTFWFNPYTKPAPMTLAAKQFMSLIESK